MCIRDRLEHIKSQKLTDELDRFLKFPQFDPHGDPIPNKEGVFPSKPSSTLNQIEAGNKIIILGVKDHSTAFLSYLESLNIKLGTEITVHKVNEYDLSIEIEYLDHKLNISNDVSKNLIVKA